MGTDTPALRPVLSAEVDRLAHLWLGLHAYHQTIAPQLAPYADDRRSWSARGKLYRQALERGGFAVRATARGVDVGYLLAARAPHPWPAVFPGSVEIWELLTLVVAPEWRARGVGSMLFDAFELHMQASPTELTMIGLLPGNTNALRFYERRGFAPTWLTLTRFMQGAEPDVAAAGSVTAVGVEDVDALRATWLAELARYRRTAAALAPYASPEHSWDALRPMLRRAAEERLLWRAATSSGGTSGFVSGHVGEDTLWADAWRTAPRVGELDTVVIADGDVDGHVRAGLLGAVDRSLRAAGVLDRAAGALPADAGAIGALERRGYKPAWLQVTRFPDRHRSVQ